jgi:hypothetical protein
VRDDAVDPLEQAQTLQILVSAGIKTLEEAREDLGLGHIIPARMSGMEPTLLAKSEGRREADRR